MRRGPPCLAKEDRVEKPKKSEEKKRAKCKTNRDKSAKSMVDWYNYSARPFRYIRYTWFQLVMVGWLQYRNIEPE